MPTFYTLDRRGVLRENESFQLNITPAANPHQNPVYANGLSNHGLAYHLEFGIHNPANNASGAIEYSLELVRQLHFPQKPSRLQSMFACEELDHAKHFRGMSQSKVSSPIFEVTTDDYHRGDMNIFNAGCNMAEFHRRLIAYWKGDTFMLSPEYVPFWEVVILLPVTIGRQVA
ncbi:MAG: hypothetical protein ACRCWW_00410 [Scandinavium sp.]|uniref:hypothetical protein n=1 Tax=Scandinavium sp. TaxID=2830653 RepID=UPI003F411BB7